jgi:hypothetical protein
MKPLFKIGDIFSWEENLETIVIYKVTIFFGEYMYFIKWVKGRKTNSMCLAEHIIRDFKKVII